MVKAHAAAARAFRKEAANVPEDQTKDYMRAALYHDRMEAKLKQEKDVESLKAQSEGLKDARAREHDRDAVKRIDGRIEHVDKLLKQAEAKAPKVPTKPPLVKQAEEESKADTVKDALVIGRGGQESKIARDLHKQATEDPNTTNLTNAVKAHMTAFRELASRRYSPNTDLGKTITQMAMNHQKEAGLLAAKLGDHARSAEVQAESDKMRTADQASISHRLASEAYRTVGEDEKADFHQARSEHFAREHQSRQEMLDRVRGSQSAKERLEPPLGGKHSET
jgi:hypothetical protein